MNPFEKETIDRLARIEEKLDAMPCIEHSKDIDSLKSFRTQALTLAGFISAMVSLIFGWLK